MYCRKCGSPVVEENAKFCGICGEPITKISYPVIPQEKIEIIEVKEEKLPSLEKDSIILGIVFITIAISILMIGIL